MFGVTDHRQRLPTINNNTFLPYIDPVEKAKNFISVVSNHLLTFGDCFYFAVFVAFTVI